MCAFGMHASSYLPHISAILWDMERVYPRNEKKIQAIEASIFWRAWENTKWTGGPKEDGGSLNYNLNSCEPLKSLRAPKNDRCCFGDGVTSNKHLNIIALFQSAQVAVGYQQSPKENYLGIVWLSILQLMSLNYHQNGEAHSKQSCSWQS